MCIELVAVGTLYHFLSRRFEITRARKKTRELKAVRIVDLRSCADIWRCTPAGLSTQCSWTRSLSIHDLCSVNVIT